MIKLLFALALLIVVCVIVIAVAVCIEDRKEDRAEEAEVDIIFVEESFFDGLE